MASKKHRIVSRKRKQNKQLIFSFVISLFFIASGIYLSYRDRILSFAVTPTTVEFSERQPPPIAVTIQAINLTLPLTAGWIKNGVWQLSQTTPLHLATSAHPGEKGNIVIYGHNKKSLFGKLKQLKVNDSLQLESADGSIHEYRITMIKTVKPTEIEAVLPTATETLTLYTCIGFLDTKRLIVQALPIHSIPVN